MLNGLLERIKYALRTPMCMSCGNTNIPPAGRFCQECAGELGLRAPRPIREMPDFACHAAASLAPRLKVMLYGYKFYDEARYAPLLGETLLHYWEGLPPLENTHPETVWVVPVPGHLGRVTVMGSIGRRFARQFGYEYHEALGWTTSVCEQHSLESRQARFDNVSGKMRLLLSKHQAPRHVIVLDDLTTTGATLREAVRAVRAEADVPVTPLAIARVPLQLV